MTAPWPIDTNGNVLAQVRFILFELEGAKFGHRVVDNPLDRGGRTLSGLTWKTYSQDYLRMKPGELCPRAAFDALSLDDVVDVILELFAMRPGIARIVDARPAARTRQRIYDGLPGGTYTITACVRRVSGRVVCARPDAFEAVRSPY